MADGTHIEWTEATWNPITGCSLASPGCTNCYAMKLAGTRLAHHPSRAGLTQDSKAGPVWTGEVRFNEEWLDQPLRWTKPRMIFVCAHGDLFHESVPDEWIDRIFAVMALCPQHTFQVLTKRSARMREYFSTRVQISPPLNGDATFPRARGHVEQHANLIAMRSGIDLPWRPRHESGGYWWGFKADMPWPLPNVWLGVSVEDQQRADERIPDLLATPAAVRWISAEPLLGPVDLCRVQGNLAPIAGYIPLESTDHKPVGIDWVVVGGESGSKARPMHPDWVRSLRDQCAAAGVPFFFKQWGEFAPGEIAGAFLDPEKPARGFTLFDNQWAECWSEVDGHCEDEPDVYRLGKKRAGRLLDGVEHNGMPGHA